MKYKNLLCYFLVTFIATLTCEADYFEMPNNTLINFTHNNGNSAMYNYPEIVGSGVALLDFDNDGDLDIYLIQSGLFKGNDLSDKIFKNLLVESGELQFQEVSKQMKLQNKNYGIGIATADINNDGWIDFLITNLSNNQVFINQKGKTYKETILKQTPKWSSSASFCDINNDGYKDLYIANYVDWSEQNNPKCYNSSSKRDYCGPNSFNGLSDDFYLNNKGNLEEKTHVYFPKMPKLPGLNVVCVDVNNDGWNDFIVANDGKPNLLWENQQGESFKEIGLFSGIAVNAEGVSEASMGMAIADFDLDNDMDIFLTHLMSETNTLYKNNGKGFFQDVSNRSGLSKESFAYTGWATGFIHVNNDIYPDLVVFNGAVEDASNKSSKTSDLAQSNQLYINGSQSQFHAITNEQWLQDKSISRGAAYGDIDNDGDIDIVTNNNNGQAQILINNLNPKQWAGYIVKNNESIKIELTKETNTMLLHSNTDGSYASAHDNRFVLNKAQVEYYDTIKLYKNNKLSKTEKIKATNNYKDLQ